MVTVKNADHQDTNFIIMQKVIIDLNSVNILHSSPKQVATLHFAAVQDPTKESLQIVYSWMDRKTVSPSPAHCIGGLSRI